MVAGASSYENSWEVFQQCTTLLNEYKGACFGTDLKVSMLDYLLLHELETYVNGAVLQTKWKPRPSLRMERTI